MTTHSFPDVPIDDSPAERIAQAVTRYGEDDVIARSVALLAGRNVGEEFLLYVGGVHAQGILDGAPALYWPEVWGARTLTFVWNDSAIDGIIAGLANQAWRVREMCARVVTLRSLPVAPAVLPLLHDENPRVRAAGARALAEVGDASHVAAISALFRDPEVEVRRAADQARKRLIARVPAAAEPAPEASGS